MDPAVLSLLLKENETITSKVQTKLKLLRDQLEQVRNQKALVIESLAEVQANNYLPPTTSTNNKTSNVVSKVSSHHKSEYYLSRSSIDFPPRDFVHDKYFLNHNNRGDPTTLARRRFIHQTHHLLSHFPFPCDRFKWDKETHLLLESLVKAKFVEKTQQQQGNNDNLSFTPDDWQEISDNIIHTLNNDVMNRVSRFTPNNSVSSLLTPGPEACRLRFLALLKTGKFLSNDSDAGSIKNDQRNKNQVEEHGDSKSLKNMILKAFGISNGDEDSDDEDQQYNNNKNNDKSKNQNQDAALNSDGTFQSSVKKEQIIELQSDAFRIARTPTEQEQEIITKFLLDYHKEILVPQQLNFPADKKPTGVARRNHLRSLLQKYGLYNNNSSSSLLTPLEKLGLITKVRTQEICPRPKHSQIGASETEVDTFRHSDLVAKSLSMSKGEGLDLLTRVKYHVFGETNPLLDPRFSWTLLSDMRAAANLQYWVPEVESDFAVHRLNSEYYVWKWDSSSSSSLNGKNNNDVDEQKLILVLLLFALIFTEDHKFIVTSGRGFRSSVDPFQRLRSVLMNGWRLAGDSTTKPIFKQAISEEVMKKIEKDANAFAPILSRINSSAFLGSSTGEVLLFLSKASVSGDSAETNVKRPNLVRPRSFNHILHFLQTSLGDWFENPMDMISLQAMNKNKKKKNFKAGKRNENENDVLLSTDDDDEEEEKSKNNKNNAEPVVLTAKQQRRVRLLRDRYQMNRLREMFGLLPAPWSLNEGNNKFGEVKSKMEAMAQSALARSGGLVVVDNVQNNASSSDDDDDKNKKKQQQPQPRGKKASSQKKQKPKTNNEDAAQVSDDDGDNNNNNNNMMMMMAGFDVNANRGAAAAATSKKKTNTNRNKKNKQQQEQEDAADSAIFGDSEFSL